MMVERSMYPDPADLVFNKTMSNDEFLKYTKEKNEIGMKYGIEQGWWENYDRKGPIPFPIIFSTEDFGSKATMAHVMVAAKMFPSVSEARKNGWNKVITVGDYRVGKFRYLVRITR